MQQADNATKLVNFIHFHGLNLPVVQHAGTDYVPAKPLNDLAGIDWRTAKRSMVDPENVVLYGTTALIPPSIAIQGGDIPTREALFIRLDRAHMFLARIQTSRMRSHGNAEAADLLLKLQVEWAGALYRYETDGIAVKAQQNRDRQQNSLGGLIKARNAITSPGERAALTAMIGDICNRLGFPIPADPQQQLPLH